MPNAREHWEAAAKQVTDSDGLRPTSRDPYLQDVLEHEIEKWIEPDQRVLDIGCGNGHSTLRFAAHAESIVGADFVEDYVTQAQKLAAKANIENAAFLAADILDLANVQERFGTFDTVVSIRCLINLPDWPSQMRALGQIAALLNPSGLYVCSEGWQEGLAGLDEARRRVGLPPLAIASYNNFMKRTEFEAEAAKNFSIEKFITMGTYIFLSRVIQPALEHPDPPSHTHHLNGVAASVMNAGIAADSFENLDYAGIYILRRR